MQYFDKHKRVTVCLTDRMHDIVRELAFKSRSNVSRVIQDALSLAYPDKIKQKKPKKGS